MSSVVKRPFGFTAALLAAGIVAGYSLWGSSPKSEVGPPAAHALEQSLGEPVQSPSDVTLDLAAARQAVEKKEYREAQRYLERALAHIPDHREAVFLLVRTADLQTRELIATEKYHEAAHRLEMTGAYVQQFAAARVEGGARAGPMADVLRVETALENIDARFRRGVAGSARERLAKAEQLANAAYRYFWFNHRDTVREGLRQAQWVQQHFKYLDSNLQGECFRVLNLLKRRVSNGEWEPMLAEAGMFEFTSD